MYFSVNLQILILTNHKILVCYNQRDYKQHEPFPQFDHFISDYRSQMCNLDIVLPAIVYLDIVLQMLEIDSRACKCQSFGG